MEWLLGGACIAKSHEEEVQCVLRALLLQKGQGGCSLSFTAC